MWLLSEENRIAIVVLFWYFDSDLKLNMIIALLDGNPGYWIL